MIDEGSWIIQGDFINNWFSFYFSILYKLLKYHSILTNSIQHFDKNGAPRSKC